MNDRAKEPRDYPIKLSLCYLNANKSTMSEPRPEVRSDTYSQKYVFSTADAIY